jgi:integrase
MARGIHRLSARSVETARSEGKVRYLPDGGSLYLRIGAGGGKSWAFRYRDGKVVREMGLGSARSVGLAAARARVVEIRTQRGQGQDPRTARRQHHVTFGEVAAEYVAAHRAKWTPRHAVEWESTLEKLALRPQRADRINTQDILAAVTAVWPSGSVQGRRVIERVRIVLDAATAGGHRASDAPNPARWSGHLEHLWPAPPAEAGARHHKAMPWQEVPAFFMRLRACEEPAARALEFIILTVARAGDVLGEYGGKSAATWLEIDLDRTGGALWTLPARGAGDRWSKSGRLREVPLPARAVELLGALPGPRTGAIFPDLHAKSCFYLLRDRLGVAGYTIHGFRASFGSWAQDHDVPWDIRELALAHAISNRTEQAYLRSDLLERRRALAEAWAQFCEGEEPAAALRGAIG